MANVRVKKDTGNLYFDFQFMKLRCREYTSLTDTPVNRKKLSVVMTKIEAEIASGKFDYARYFPNSPMLNRLQEINTVVVQPIVSTDIPVIPTTPYFKDFAAQWFDELRPTWRSSTAKGYQAYIDNRLNPYFGEMMVGCIGKADILKFRSMIAKSANGKLKPKTINKFLKLFKMIIDEAAIRYDFNTPYRGIKPLKEDKVHIEPFTVEEVNKIISHVRADWRAYLIVRFFTGMRTGEIDGLKWKYVDFDKRQILVRETHSYGQWEYTKNDGSQREIEMNQLVYDALMAHKQAQGGLYECVFVTRDGQPISNSNFLHRVWTPLLAYLGIPYRRPYETRHTSATLWLGAGENPTWIAKQMGHSNTEMLFTVYTRYVPNLTRQDGSAMERLIAASIQITPPTSGIALSPERVATEVHHWDQLLTSDEVAQHG
ncbi:site-specific integrase [Sulfuriferula nivalis]|uniref:Integrase n=1 Tax=Sulfuriferula nivalis TaxID=2675298 RepID=A0A809RGI1_9PROT|nr:site-specific integrase [Sulfuriferula nivalis]BBP00746.1 integrase [Sulfuriferula nivalis]